MTTTKHIIMKIYTVDQSIQQNIATVIIHSVEQFKIKISSNGKFADITIFSFQ